MQKKWVYIASPYTKGDMILNVRESFLVADELLRYGYVPFPPLFSAFWHFLSPKNWDTWLTLDLEFISRCDYLLRLPGESRGADIEVAHAKSFVKPIPVFTSVQEILEYDRRKML